MRRFVPGILVVSALTGCAQAPAPVVAVSQPRPTLPSMPTDFGKPVVVRAPKAGEDARVYAAREKAGRLTANRRLSNDAAFYAGVVKGFGAH